MKKDALLLLALLFFLSKGGLGFKVPSPNTTKHPVPKPPAWWDALPDIMKAMPNGYPAGAPWPPFDDQGNWVWPKDASGNTVP